eukprot:CAMPEP_0204318124 /NCGR_PEP_ID=MMETSP0469-20131031/6361_1 /ASSEMBLY_ACC=CAM_ASM_000384 /TAXON_ID=2969 /ORGANISM="Oxyrrhis marina" /LENGTH=414 /DNA_ID=CAMNT_0051299139 /DNA_START=49 /DNA_END=1293 /DNA_ORIENTATION=-
MAGVEKAPEAEQFHMEEGDALLLEETEQQQANPGDSGPGASVREVSDSWSSFDNGWNESNKGSDESKFEALAAVHLPDKDPSECESESVLNDYNVLSGSRDPSIRGAASADDDAGTELAEEVQGEGLAQDVSEVVGSDAEQEEIGDSVSEVQDFQRAAPADADGQRVLAVPMTRIMQVQVSQMGQLVESNHQIANCMASVVATQQMLMEQQMRQAEEFRAAHAAQQQAQQDQTARLQQQQVQLAQEAHRHQWKMLGALVVAAAVAFWYLRKDARKIAAFVYQRLLGQVSTAKTEMKEYTDQAMQKSLDFASASSAEARRETVSQARAMMQEQQKQIQASMDTFTNQFRSRLTKTERAARKTAAEVQATKAEFAQFSQPGFPYTLASRLDPNHPAVTWLRELVARRPGGLINLKW